MFRILFRAACTATALATLTGCGSSGGGPEASPGVVAISNDEAYRGQLAAAVLPVQFPGGSAADRNWLQHEIARGIDESEAFATVIRLSARGEANEAEVIIDPTVVSTQRYSGGLDRVDLRLRASNKSTGRVGLDKVYRGKRAGKTSAISDATAAASKDLKRAYGQPPVY